MNEPLERLRKQIDKLDEELLNVLAKRMAVAKEIGEQKRADGVQPLDEGRWREVLRSRIAMGRSRDIAEEFVKNLYDLIHEYSLELQRKGEKI